MYLVINKWVIAVKVSNFSGQYLRNYWTFDVGVLGYIGIVWPKEHSPEVWSVPPVTLCISLFNSAVPTRTQATGSQYVPTTQHHNSNCPCEPNNSYLVSAPLKPIIIFWVCDPSEVITLGVIILDIGPSFTSTSSSQHSRESHTKCTLFIILWWRSPIAAIFHCSPPFCTRWTNPPLTQVQ